MTEVLVCPECGNESPLQPLDGVVVACMRSHLHKVKRPIRMVYTVKPE